ncbi:hypothetical protein [Paraburkholderia terrae]
MYKYQFVVKNYRCFSDENPARFVISRGMICFIGVNNSGKSALLKFFQEFRNVWTSAGAYVGGGQAPAFGTQFQHVLDQSEVFCDQNDRPLSIEITILDVPEAVGENQLPIDKVVMSCGRDVSSTAPSWSLTYFVGDEPLPQTPPGQQHGTDGRGGLQFLGRNVFCNPELISPP